MESTPRFMKDKLLTGGEWVANRVRFEGFQRPLAHTSPYLTRLPRHDSSSAVLETVCSLLRRWQPGERPAATELRLGAQ